MNGNKTYAVAALMILHALSAYALGHDPALNLQEILAALGLSALRAGVKKAERPEPPPSNLLSILFLCSLCFHSIQSVTTASGASSGFRVPGFELGGGASVLASREPGVWTNRLVSSLAPPQQLPNRLVSSLAPPEQPGTPKPERGTARSNPDPEAYSKASRLYFDSFVTARTPNFSEATYGYGLGIGYQVSPYWSADFRAGHSGFDTRGSVVQDLGGRLVARMPFEFLAPYAFLGASFDLERDRWLIQPGAGIELGVNKRLRGLSLFAEGGLNADLHGRHGYVFNGGVRLRF
jgi:hypothetical protein